MINISNISIQYGGRFLFDNISFAITEKDRIGLVGKNGAGKSTLLKILIEEIVPESGGVSMDNHTTLGYLPQTLKLNPTQTVYEETAKAFIKIKEVEQEIEALTQKIGEYTEYESDEYFKLLTRLSNAQEHLAHIGGTNMREETEKILKGLGFVNGDFDRPLSEFSGGWQMRVELAKILLQKPTFILLDEPTNHLDIESIMWLEGFLKDYPGGVVLISHDRAFLDGVTNRTVEIVAGKIYDYRTSYSKFVELREKRREKQVVDAKKQAKEIEETEMLINKFRAKKNKAKFAQTLIRKLDKMERIEVDDVEKDSINFRFPEAQRSGKEVVKIDKLSKNYGEVEVLKEIDFLLERGEKIAFVGKNGEGKSTLAKIITNNLDYTGDCTIGYNVSIGYYEQHQAESLDPNKTVFQTIDDAAVGEMRLKVRSLLGAFLFSGEDVEKKVMVLSGGEKSRLAIAKMLLQPYNLLVLDEPTNHLDMQSKNILKNALLNFERSLIIVSHDREFLKGLTDKVYEFRDKKIKQYFGDVYDFLEQRKINSLDDLGMNSRQERVDMDAAAQKKARIELREKTRELDKSIKRVQNRISKTERNIDELEKKIAAHEDLMNDPTFYTEHPNADKVLHEHAAFKEQLETAMNEWEEWSLEVEELREEREKYG